MKHTPCPECNTPVYCADYECRLRDDAAEPDAPPPGFEQPAYPIPECLTDPRDEEIADLRRILSGHAREGDRLAARYHEALILCMFAHEFLSMPALVSTRVGETRMTREEVIEALGTVGTHKRPVGSRAGGAEENNEGDRLDDSGIYSDGGPAMVPR